MSNTNVFLVHSIGQHKTKQYDRQNFLASFSSLILSNTVQNHLIKQAAKEQLSLTLFISSIPIEHISTYLALLTFSYKITTIYTRRKPEKTMWHPSSSRRPTYHVGLYRRCFSQKFINCVIKENNFDDINQIEDYNQRTPVTQADNEEIKIGRLTSKGLLAFKNLLSTITLVPSDLQAAMLLILANQKKDFRNTYTDL